MHYALISNLIFLLCSLEIVAMDNSPAIPVTQSSLLSLLHNIDNRLVDIEYRSGQKLFGRISCHDNCDLSFNLITATSAVSVNLSDLKCIYPSVKTIDDAFADADLPADDLIDHFASLTFDVNVEREPVSYDVDVPIEKLQRLTLAPDRCTSSEIWHRVVNNKRVLFYFNEDNYPVFVIRLSGNDTEAKSLRSIFNRIVMKKYFEVDAGKLYGGTFQRKDGVFVICPRPAMPTGSGISKKRARGKCDHSLGEDSSPVRKRRLLK